jgi:hypothetical protein
MGRSIDHSDDLKWYPRSWRDHYGEELMLFLQDRYGEDPVPVTARLSMIRSGSVERLRAGGIIGTSVDSDRRIRGASLLVLCAWGMFVVAGAVFAKYTEHWPLATPQVDQRVPEVAMGIVQVAAAAGFLILVVAGLITLPALVALVRSDGWKSIWATARWMVISVAVAGTAAIVIVAWNAQLGPSQSINTPWSLKVAGVVGGLLVVLALAVSSGTIVAIVYRLRLSDQVTRMLGVLAFAMSGVLIFIFAGALTWWITTAIHAPWFFGSFVPRSQSSPAPLAMVVLGLTMLSGLVLAGYGTVRIAVSMGRSGGALAPAGRTE